MSKNITIIDPEYKEWIKGLSLRYRKSQIKAAVKVNSEMLKFYWSLGRDIVCKKAESKWGDRFYRNLSADLRNETPDASCFSETNLKYMKYFYEMFPLSEIRPQPVDEIRDEGKTFQAEVVLGKDEISPQLVDELSFEIFSVPWGHYRLLIDKFKNQPEKAKFFIHKIVSEGWSRDMLLNFINLSCYVAIEVKIGEFDFPDLGQIQGYVVLLFPLFLRAKINSCDS